MSFFRLLRDLRALSVHDGIDRTRILNSGAAASATACSAALDALDEIAAVHAFELLGGSRSDLLADAASLLAEIQASGASIPAGTAWRLGLAHHVRGEYRQASEYFASADAHPEGTGGDDSDVDVARLFAAQASTLWAQGDPVRSKALADSALEIAGRSGDEAALANAWIVQALVAAAQGDRAANVRAYEHALDYASRAGDVLTVVRVRSNRGSMYLEEGRYLEALAELDHVFELAELGNTGLVGALAYVNRAEVLLRLGRLDEARAEVEIARNLCLVADSPMVDFALLLEGEIHRTRGHAARARASYQEVLERSASSANAQVISASLSGLARTTIADDPTVAQDFAQRAVNEPSALGNVGALLADGWVALAIGDLDTAEARALGATTEAGRRHDLPSLADALELGALVRWSRSKLTDVRAALAEAADIWSETGDGIRLAANRLVRAKLANDAAAEAVGRQALEAFGVRVDAFRIAGPLWVVGLPSQRRVVVRTLGRFEVLIDGEPVATSGWRSRKSRQIVTILASRRGRRMSRDELCEILWPGVSDTRARLSVGLSNARAALDPGRLHGPDHFLIADRDQVWLDPATVDIDLVEFDGYAEAGLAAADAVNATSTAGRAEAVNLLQAAAARYGAPFLADEASEDWIFGVRDLVRAQAIAVKRALARLIAASDDPERAVAWWVSVLDDDPFDEAAHLALIAALGAAQRHGEARRAHSVYLARMAELGVTPQQH